MKAGETHMDIKATNTWTVSKGDCDVDLTLDDIQQLFRHLAMAGDIMVFDVTSGHCWSGDDIVVSANGNAVQISVGPTESQHSASDGVEKSESDDDIMRAGVLAYLGKKTATRKFLRAWLNASTKARSAMLDHVLADLRAEGIVELSHGEFRLRQPAPVVTADSNDVVGGD